MGGMVQPIPSGSDHTCPPCGGCGYVKKRRAGRLRLAIRILGMLALVWIVGSFLAIALADNDPGEIFALVGGAIGASFPAKWFPHRASSKP